MDRPSWTHTDGKTYGKCTNIYLPKGGALFTGSMWLKGVVHNNDLLVITILSSSLYVSVYNNLIMSLSAMKQECERNASWISLQHAFNNLQTQIFA